MLNINSTCYKYMWVCLITWNVIVLWNEWKVKAGKSVRHTIFSATVHSVPIWKSVLISTGRRVHPILSHPTVCADFNKVTSYLHTRTWIKLISRAGFDFSNEISVSMQFRIFFFLQYSLKLLDLQLFPSCYFFFFFDPYSFSLLPVIVSFTSPCFYASFHFGSLSWSHFFPLI